MYSDINFIMLGALVERVFRRDPGCVHRQTYFCAAGKMARTRFGSSLDVAAKIAPTQYDEKEHLLRGKVHDPTARRMGGVAGHAGLFSTGDDLAKFAQALLNGGEGILSADTVEKMTSPEQPPQAPVLRGLWLGISILRFRRIAGLAAGRSFGHTGFTGTSMWIDPTTQTYIILLTNSVHPRGKGNAIGLRTKVATEVAAALQLSPSEKEAMRWKSNHRLQRGDERRAAHEHPQWDGIKTGIDMLEEACV